MLTLRVRWLLMLLFPVLAGLSPLPGGAGLLVAATALTVVAAAFVVAGFAAAPSPALVRGRGVALRQRAHRAAYLRLRDPDAAGRPRPRAPGASRPLS